MGRPAKKVVVGGRPKVTIKKPHRTQTHQKASEVEEQRRTKRATRSNTSETTRI